MRTPILLAALCAVAVVPFAVSAQVAYETGYYDNLGHWIPTAPSAAESGFNTTYTSGAGIRAREAWLRNRIDVAETNGDLSVGEARSARLELNAIRRRDDLDRAGSGVLTLHETASLQARLDDLQRRVHAMTE
jgi:hypothetical protein